MDKNVSKKISSDTSFTDIVEVVYLNKENSFFTMTKNGFLCLVSSHDVKPERLFDDENEQGEKPFRNKNASMKKPPCEIKYTPDGKRDYGRVVLHRAFPFMRPYSMISVQCEDGLEIGIIKDISDFDEETAKILKKSLDEKYCVPVITKILSAKSQFGFLYFNCETSLGKTDFIVRNPHGSIIHVSAEHVVIIDIDGNRFAIPDVNKLDKKSFRKIELYI